MLEPAQGSDSWLLTFKILGIQVKIIDLKQYVMSQILFFLSLPQPPGDVLQTRERESQRGMK